MEDASLCFDVVEQIVKTKKVDFKYCCRKDKNYMNELQKVILDIFKEYRNLCERHGLRYFAIGGTCIGAIRHKGFIPWDDDLDVVMPWDDYQKFRIIAAKELTSPYELYDFESHKHCTHLFMKIHNVSTTFIEEEYSVFEDRKTGVFMDVMPMVGLPVSKEKTIKYINECKMLSRWNYAHRFSVFERKSMKNNTIKSRLFSILTLPFRIGKSYNFYSKKYEQKLNTYSYEDADAVFFAWRTSLKGTYKNVFPKSIFDQYLEVPFEDTSIRVPKDYDRYLRMDFGDYMKLPPIDKQISVHDAEIIDLGNSYR